MVIIETQVEVSTPYPAERLELVWKWLNDYREQTLDDHSPKSLEELVEKYERDLANGSLFYAVWKEGETPLGIVWFELMGDGMYCGHLVFERKTLTREEIQYAVELAMLDFFEHGRKIYWQFLASNRAFHIFLLRLGATEEGYMREGGRCDGKLVDVRLMASFPKGDV